MTTESSLSPKPPIVRRCKSVTLTLDDEAQRLLRSLAPGPRVMGHYVSGLLRAEADRRVQRMRLLQGLDEAQP